MPPVAGATSLRFMTLRSRFVAGVLVVAMASLAPAAQAIGETDRGASYPQPQAGPWKYDDSFGDSTGTLKVKAGKTPLVKSIKITVTQQDNGYECPAPGAVLKVKGSFPLRKAPKWAEDDYDNKFAWISAKKDKPYDDDYPNQLGMKPVPATVTVGGQTRNAALSISFIKLNFHKPHSMKLELRLFPSDGSTGWCLFSLEGKPGK